MPTAATENLPEVTKWSEFGNRFSAEPEAAINRLNEELSDKTVLLGYGIQISEADKTVYSALHSFVSQLSEADMQKYPNVIRWMDYVQNKEDFGGALPAIVVKKQQFEHFCSINVDKTSATEASKKVVQASSKDVVKTSDAKASKKVSESSKDAENAEKKINAAKDSTGKKDSKKATKESKTNQPDKDSSEKEVEISVAILNIQVGLIRKAWKHPSADSLLVEEIDLGDGNVRQVVSGLAKYCDPENLTNRRVALITNVKPGKLRDVMSAGLVLCASNQDHTVVEPLIPPEGAIIGERITFSGYDGKPEDVLNPKKKQLEKITPHLYTDDNGVATYKGVPFMTSAGPCTSSISKASIK